MTAVSDPLLSLCAFLRHAIGDMLVEATNPNGVTLPAVFRPDLPKWFDENMPAECVVLRPAGGYKMFGKSMFYVGDPNVDIICYGTEQGNATTIAQAVVVSLKQLVTQVWENNLLYSANIVGGPIPLPDSQTVWPACWLSCQLMTGELPVAA